jgi:hypothetical protein
MRSHVLITATLNRDTISNSNRAESSGRNSPPALAEKVLGLLRATGQAIAIALKGLTITTTG